MDDASPCAFRPTAGEWCWLAAAALLIGVQLFLPPFVGLADQGDYARLAGPFGLQPVTGPDISGEYLRLVHRFDLGDPGGGGYLSSQLLVVLAAVLLSPLDGDLATIDLRLVGLLNTLLLLAASWLVLVALRPLGRPARAVAAVGLLVVVTDGVSVAFLSSFYSEPASLVTLLALVGLGLRWTGGAGVHPSHWKAVLLAALLLLSAKQQNAPLGPLLAGALLLAARQGAERPLRLPREVLAGTAAVLVLAPLVYLSLTPSSMRENFTYHAIFLELVPSSPTPREDLAELGLDPTLERFRGTNAYEEASGMRVPQVRDALREQVGAAALGRFYVLHPERLLDLLRRGVGPSLVSRPSALGTFPQEAGRPFRDVDRRFSRYSDAKAAAAPASAVVVPAVLAVAAVAGPLAARRERRNARPGGPDARWLALLAACAAAELIVVLLAEGTLDLARRLYLFSVLLDLCALGTAVLVVEAATRRLRRRPTRS